MKHSARAHFLVLVLYLALTAFFLFPLPFQLADHVPDWGDPLENAWVLAWNAHQLVFDPLQIYHANIYYPFPNSLAFSESQFASSVLALPIFFASGNAILAYNFVFCAAFVFMAFNTYLLAYDVTRQRAAAILAGMAFAFWSYPFNHLSHLNLVTLQYIPLVFFALRRALQKADLKFALLFAIALTAQALSSWYAALMTSLGIVVYLLYAFVAHRREIRLRALLQLALVALPALLLIVILALPYFQVNRAFGLERSLDDAQIFSATPSTFFTVAPQNRFYANLLLHNNADALFPGILVLLLAFVGLVNRHARERWAWLGMIIFFALIAFGPASPLYRALHEYLPGFQGTRAPARFFVVGMLGLSVLAAIGFQFLAQKFSARAATALSIAACVIITLEFFSAPISVVPIETGEKIPQVYRWLAQQAESNYVEMPLRGGDVEFLTRAMYFSTIHWHATPLGYGSFAPAQMQDVMNVLNGEIEPPATRIINLLREYNVRYWIFHSDKYTDDEWKKISAALVQVEGVRAAWNDSSDFVYAIQGDAPAHPLTFSYLVPQHARAHEKFVGYLVARHSRRYPIVNDDLNAHQATLTWQCPNAPPVTQTFSLALPPVLRERAVGVPFEIIAPNTTGECETTFALDNNPLNAFDGTTRVTISNNANETDAALELLGIATTSREILLGNPFSLNLLWRARQRVREDLRVAVTVYDPNENIVYETLEHPLLSFTYPTSQWRVQELTAIEYPIPISPDAPTGTYRIEIELLDANATQQIPFVTMDGSAQTILTDSIKVLPR